MKKEKQEMHPFFSFFQWRILVLYSLALCLIGKVL